VPYLSFYQKLHCTRAGRVLYRHSYVFDRKFLGPYLSTHLDTWQKLSIQKHLVCFLEAKFQADFLSYLSAGGVFLWQKSAEDEDHKIMLRLADASKFEGDFALEYVFNGECLHRLSFVFSPGHIFDLPDSTVAFAGGSQGVNGGRTDTRSAARSNGGIHPANMLLLALRAICQSLDITGICAVTSRFQLFNLTQCSPRPENYELLWSMNGGTPFSHFYYMGSELEIDDSEPLTGTHRTRKRRRRRLRQQTIDDIANEVRLHLRKRHRHGDQDPGLISPD
jgi:uncharacterized protein VirK/YbjX